MIVAFVKKKRYAGLLLFCLLLAAVTVSVWADAAYGSTGSQMLNTSGNQNLELSVDPIRKSEGYSTILYDSWNGLPTSDANAIAQTGEGFIWVGSYAGLIRYDSNTFERMDSATGISNVRCLYVDSQDRLWIGTNDSGVFLMAREIVRNWNKTSGLESASIRAIIEDEGLFYIGSAAGISIIDAEMNLTVLRDERVSGQIIREFRRSVDGLIYGLTENGDLFTMKDGRLLSFLSHDECRIDGILSILPDPKHPGYLYLGTEDSLVYRGSMERNFSSLGVKDISPLSYVECFEYINGEIWICAGNGIGKLDGEGFHQLLNVPMDRSVGHVMTDYEGNLWFTSTRQGVMKIVPNQFSDLFERYGLPAAVVNSTCMYGQLLFIGTDIGLIVIENKEKLDALPLTEAVTASGEDLGISDLLPFLDGVRIRSIIRDSQGRLWISTWRKRGLLCFDQGKLIAFTQEDGLLSDQVRMISEFEDGSIMVANTGGVSVIRDGTVVACYGEADGIIVGEILTIAEGFNHEIILGSDGGGIYIIGDDDTKHIGTEDGLNAEVILRIKRSREHNVHWIVTSNSLAFMTPDYRITTLRQFPYSNNYDLYENSKGDMWVLSSNGIYVSPEEKMLENGQIDPMFYGIASGLPYIATANSYSEQTLDGDLYIAGSMGVIKVNIEKPFRDKTEMKVSLPYIDADHVRYYPDSSGNFHLPGKARKLTIYPYVFNYSLADVQVSYRLEGFDTTDVTVSPSKLMPVDYTNLRMGEFHFSITVKDLAGHSEQTVSFQIIKGKEMSVGTVGTLIMINASLFLICGILMYTSPYRKRRQLKDKLMTGLLCFNLAMAIGELMSYLLEYTSIPLARELTIAGNTVFYICLVFFPYLLWVYIDFCADPNPLRVKKTKLLYGIPCFVFIAVTVANIITGWIFSVSEENAFVFALHGWMVFLPVLPVWFYLILSLIRLAKINARLVALGMVLIAARLIGEICYQSISSTSFVYTLVLLCICLYEMNQPMDEVAP